MRGSLGGTRNITWRAELLQDAPLMAEVRVEVSARSADGGVTKPSLDDVDLHACFKQMDGRRVAKAVRRDSSACEAGASLGRAANVSLGDGPYSEAGEGSAPLIDEEAVYAVVRLAAIAGFVVRQQPHC